VTPFAWFKWLRRIVLAIVLIVVVLIGDVWIHIWWVAREDEHPRSDAIIVLGASQYNGTPSPVFAARLNHAADLYKEGVAPHIVTVGGKQPGDAYTEAQAGKIYLHKQGIPRKAIIDVQTGSDTLTSLRAVSDQFKAQGWKTAVIVTDPWHCLRSRSMARHRSAPVRRLGAVASRSVTSPARLRPTSTGRSSTTTTSTRRASCDRQT
jgi:uncharacterized SAM-binding protein YcdF (DUF218 family)